MPSSSFLPNLLHQQFLARGGIMHLPQQNNPTAPFPQQNNPATPPSSEDNMSPPPQMDYLKDDEKQVILNSKFIKIIALIT